MRLVLHVEAQKDLDELIDYIASRGGRLIAEQQLTRAHTALKTIERFPRASRYDARLDFFEAWLPRTRFIVFYRILEDRDLVVVLAVIDHARNTLRTKRRVIRSRA